MRRPPRAQAEVDQGPGWRHRSRFEAAQPIEHVSPGGDERRRAEVHLPHEAVLGSIGIGIASPAPLARAVRSQDASGLLQEPETRDDPRAHDAGVALRPEECEDRRQPARQGDRGGGEKDLEAAVAALRRRSGPPRQARYGRGLNLAQRNAGRGGALARSAERRRITGRAELAREAAIHCLEEGGQGRIPGPPIGVGNYRHAYVFSPSVETARQPLELGTLRRTWIDSDH